MKASVSVRLVANAGLLLEYQGVKLLVDGLFGPEGHSFSSSPQETEKLLSGAPPYESVDYLLFTHCHPDHFSQDLTLEYLQKNKVKGLALPELESPALRELAEYLSAKHIPALALSASQGRISFRPAPGLSIQALPVKHLDPKYQAVPHFCYLITCGEKNILLTSDADYVHEDFAPLAGLRLSAVFVNPLFFNALCHKRFFKGSLDAERFCVYHLPFPEEDTIQAHAALSRDLRLWDASRGSVTVLDRSGQTLLL